MRLGKARKCVWGWLCDILGYFGIPLKLRVPGLTKMRLKEACRKVTYANHFLCRIM